MAKRYRYAFAKKREAQQGKLSAVLAAVSLVLFVTAVLLAFFLQGQYGYIVGGISLCAMLLSWFLLCRNRHLILMHKLLKIL